MNTSSCYLILKLSKRYFSFISSRIVISYACITLIRLLLWIMDEMNILHSTNDIQLVSANSSGFDGIFWVLILINLITIAIVQTTQRGYIRLMFNTCVFNRLLYQNLQNDLRLTAFGALSLLLAYANCLTILIFEFTHLAYTPYTLLVPVAILFLILLKFGIIQGLSFLTLVKNGLTEHLYNHLLFFQAGAIILTPILIFSHFLSAENQYYTTLFSLIIAGFLVLVREFQSFTRAIRVKISLFYIILYLCTLELLPFVVAIHVLVNKTTGFN